MSTEQIANPDLVAYCGLYCGACGAFRKGRCPGCHNNEKASWCKIRTCNKAHGYSSCADCVEFPDPTQCKKFNNLISKIFSVVLRSNRPACISQIKMKGLTWHAQEMHRNGWQSLKR